jgi:pimeloyl-ACP methyl ester carboxylesterase
MAQPHKKKRNTPLALSILRLAFALGGRLFPTLAAHYAYQLWFKAPRFEAPRREQQWREHATVSVIDHEGLPVTIYQWGEGPVVFLVHGWSGRGLQLGAIGMALAKQGFKAVAIDLPAHGRTPGSQTDGLVMAAALQSVLQHFEAAHGFVSHSFGAFPVTYLLRHGVQAQRVVCISPPDNLRYLMELFANTLRLPPAVVKRLYQRTEQDFGTGIWDEISADKNVVGLTIPAMIIHDENDAYVAYQHGEVVARAWPGASFYRTSGLGHRRILRDKGVIDKVCRFIKCDE